MEDWMKTRLTGKFLNEEWQVNASHALFSQYGNWFDMLQRFPGALFDEHGYILFKTEKEFQDCPYLEITNQINCRSGISTIPGYKRMT
jgi:hypothetical protein